MRPEVVITGLGVISPLGAGRETFWRNLLAGKSGMGPVTRFDTAWLPNHVAAEVTEPPAAEFLSPAEAGALALPTAWMLAASREALHQAGALAGDGRAGLPLEFFMGTTLGNMFPLAALQTLQTEKTRHEQVQRIVTDNVIFGPARQVAASLGLSVPGSVVANACAAGAYAISLGVEYIRQGRAQAVLCGGVDMLSVSNFAGFCRLGAMSPDVCRPFTRGRRGLILGEGAAALILESAETANRRGAAVLARVLGYGWSSDAYHLAAVHPEGRGAVLAMRRALTDAGLAADGIDAICAHATGTRGNDRVEAQAIAAVFGQPTPTVTAAKSMLGHAMGAASALDALIATLMVQADQIPPALSEGALDPECPIEVVTDIPARRTLRACLTAAYGFGGNNACLVVGKPSAGPSSHA